MTTTHADPAQEESRTSSAMAVEDRAEAILDHIINTKGGTRREGQVRMARLVARNLTSQNPTLLQGGTGIGKALDVTTPIPTPTGFTPIGALQVGDEVFDEHGEVCRVTHAFDVLHDRPCSEITFSDGSVLIADDEHQWDTVERHARRNAKSDDPWTSAETVTTAQIKDTLVAPGQQRRNHAIPLAAPVQTRPSDMPIDPYGLGLWLGGTNTRTRTQTNDVGSTSTPPTAYIKQSNAPTVDVPGFVVRTETSTNIGLEPTDETFTKIKKVFPDGTYDNIPTTFLFGPEEERRALLAGLLDASGFVVGGSRHVGGQVQFSEYSDGLARDTHTLACSLGFRATLNRRTRDDGSLVTWLVAFSPDTQVFRHAAQKNQRLGTPNGIRRTKTRTITSVVRVPSRPVRCISVDSSRHLYLAGTSFIPTHNSIGYLAGALASGKQVVVAPHTKALQDQLGADLDLISSAFADGNETALLDHTPTYSIIKGRSAYLCLNKVRGEPDPEQLTLTDAPPVDAEPSTDLGKEVKALSEWADDTDTGDRSALPFQVTSKAWSQVSVSADDCGAKACPFYRDENNLCFAERSRAAAKEADIVVVNQAYLAMAMKYPALLPGTVEAIVVDEAHEFASVVANTFGAQVTARRLRNVLEKTAPLKAIDENVESHREALSRVVADFDDTIPAPKSADRDLITKPQVTRVLEKAGMLLGKLSHAASGMPQADDTQVAKRDLMMRMLNNLIFDLDLLLTGTTDRQVAWVENEYGKARLRSAQFDVADTTFERLLEPFRSVVFTSATLTVAGRFEQTAKNYGFARAPWRGEIVDSPFNYPEQGLVWTPTDIPFPSNKPVPQEKYHKAVAGVVERVARAAEGRTLVLCTSRSSVLKIADLLEASLGRAFPLLVQEPGEPTKPLAEAFGDDPRAVLIGTRTFWSGVSIEGDTCAAVVLDKLPFPSPGEPIIAAQGEKADRNGGSGFREVYLSEACLTVVQGAGRLIRTVSDRGVVVLCDPRVHQDGPHRKRYGSDVMRSLPPFPVTSDESRVTHFLQTINQTADDARGAVVVEDDEATGAAPS